MKCVLLTRIRSSNLSFVVNKNAIAVEWGKRRLEQFIASTKQRDTSRDDFLNLAYKAVTNRVVKVTGASPQSKLRFYLSFKFSQIFRKETKT